MSAVFIPVRVKRATPLPKFLRPKITPKAKLSAKVIHWDLVTAFVSGKADQEILWDWIETGYTYSKMMQLLIDDGIKFEDSAVAALTAQLNVYPSVIERWRKTGKAGFNGEELAVAREAAQVMDALLDLDRHGIADQAGRWSLEQMHWIRHSANSNKKASA